MKEKNLLIGILIVLGLATACAPTGSELSVVLPTAISNAATAVSSPNAQVVGDRHNINCPRNIGENCWVIREPAVNEPIAFFSSDGWKAIAGKYVSFRVPVEWTPTAVTPGGGSVLEEWSLGIPGVDPDQVVAFFSLPFEALQPPDLESETPFEIGDQPGAKWIRSGQGYVSYDYYTTGIAGAGSFGIHVTVP